MTVAQMDTFRAGARVRPAHEWDKWEGLDHAPAALEAFIAKAPFFSGGGRRLDAPAIEHAPAKRGDPRLIFSVNLRRHGG